MNERSKPKSVWYLCISRCSLMRGETLAGEVLPAEQIPLGNKAIMASCFRPLDAVVELTGPFRLLAQNLESCLLFNANYRGLFRSGGGLVALQWKLGAKTVQVAPVDKEQGERLYRMLPEVRAPLHPLPEGYYDPVAARMNLAERREAEQRAKRANLFWYEAEEWGYPHR